MITITKEFTKDQLQQIIETDHVQCGEASALARIALASLEAEAVCYLTWHQGFRAPDDCEEYVVEANPGDKSCDGSPAFPVYAAPPAPVSVNITRDQIRDIFMRNGFTIKDGQTDLKDYVYAAADELVSLLKTQAPVSVPDAMEMDDDFDSAFEHGKAVGWNAYRAAMLQSFGNSEQLNSPVIPDGWVACSERMPDNDDFVYIWPRPDFGVELHVAQYGKFDKRDAGWYAQVYEQNYGIEYYPIKVTHWMALPAAPQQEVKP
ncbi:hypothetical protein CSB66_1842 [Enterobacter hormaechei]|uniref:DUF551 domain-containing protein n=1 Tax=Enterobacter hormaechei TaxID=158836 RepID=UPI0005EEF8D8|nr:DUF551 domain-containing protein [Enterobacter hormaechei]KJO83816.1 hypothetical protein SR98_01540 [Enterobacter hormaechei subsp. xiangfangensis]KJP34370.1 hypothetical protein SR78_08080 [Enterobacter hormaechei subsp. xiangfangensis]RCG81034.1 hypothetical protein CSB66_1842 [Enterobacter hormaechei]